MRLRVVGYQVQVRLRPCSRVPQSKRPSSAASARFGAFAGMKLRTKPKA